MNNNKNKLYNVMLPEGGSKIHITKKSTIDRKVFMTACNKKITSGGFTNVLTLGEIQNKFTVHEICNTCRTRENIVLG